MLKKKPRFVNPSKIRLGIACTYFGKIEPLLVCVRLSVHHLPVPEYHNGGNLRGEHGVTNVKALGHSWELADINLTELEVIQAVPVGKMIWVTCSYGGNVSIMRIFICDCMVGWW